MSIPVLFSTRTGQYHFADDDMPICRSKLDSRDQWIHGAVASIVDDVLCPVCIEARKMIPALRGEPVKKSMQCVYIVRQMGSHYYKIGVASDPDRRVKELQTSNPAYLQIVWRSEYCDRSVAISAERRMHQEYRHVRSAQSTQREWFNLGPHEVNDIQEKIAERIGVVC